MYVLFQMTDRTLDKLEKDRSRIADSLMRYTESLSTIQLAVADQLQNVEAVKAKLANERKNQPPDPPLKKVINMVSGLCFYRYIYFSSG